MTPPLPAADPTTRTTPILGLISTYVSQNDIAAGNNGAIDKQYNCLIRDELKWMLKMGIYNICSHTPIAINNIIADRPPLNNNNINAKILPKRPERIIEAALY